jgi:hypothetical protein
VPEIEVPGKAAQKDVLVASTRGEDDEAICNGEYGWLRSGE